MPQGAMTETAGVSGLMLTLLRSAATAFAFGEAALFAVEPALTKDVVLMNVAELAAGRAGSTGVGVVTACLMFTAMLVSLGCGFLLAAMAMQMSAKAGALWLAEAAVGACLVVGAVGTGALVGVLQPWMYLTSQGVLVLIAYSSSNINDMTTALLIIFTTLYLSVVYGRMGLFLGLLVMVLTISMVFALRRALTKRMSKNPKPKTSCRLLERIFFYGVFVGLLGFSVGVVAGEQGGGPEAEVVVMLQSVLWVTFLSAGLLGGGLGTVAVVGLRPEVVGQVAVGAAVLSSVSLRVILRWSSPLGVRSSVAGALGAAAAAGVSLGAAGVAAKQAFESRKSTLTALGSVVVGTVLATQAVALKTTTLTLLQLISISLVAVLAFVLGAPKSPFHTEVNLERGLLTGLDLIKGIGMETVTAAAAPIGAGALGAAALATAALGTLGTVGIMAAVLLAWGSTLSGMIGKSPAAVHAHTE